MRHVIAVAILLTGCATTQPKQIVQYKTVQVPVYLHATIPAQYVLPLSALGVVMRPSA